MMKHRILFNMLWRNFTIIAECARKCGHHIAIEWPKGCSYWLKPKVCALLSRYATVNAMFDGCMFAVKSHKHADMLIKKPWRVSTTSFALYSAFHGKKCDASRNHVPCQGSDTKLTEEYSHEMVKHIHISWKKHANHIMQTKARKRANAPVTLNNIHNNSERNSIACLINTCSTRIAASKFSDSRYTTLVNSPCPCIESDTAMFASSQAVSKASGPKASGPKGAGLTSRKVRGTDVIFAPSWL